MIVPHGHDKDMASLQTLSHALQTTLLAKVVRIAKGNLGLQTEFVRDGVHNVHACKFFVIIWRSTE